MFLCSPTNDALCQFFKNIALASSVEAGSCAKKSTPSLPNESCDVQPENTSSRLDLDTLYSSKQMPYLRPMHGHVRAL